MNPAMQMQNMPMMGGMNPMMGMMPMMNPMMGGMTMMPMNGMNMMPMNGMGMMPAMGAMMPMMMCKMNCRMTDKGMVCEMMPMDGMSADMFMEYCKRMMAAMGTMPMMMASGGMMMCAMA